jgi:N-acetylneuraminate synthase
MNEFRINDRLIQSGQPTYIIAEISANHNHNYDNTVALIKAAKDAGADAIKLQTYTADTLTIDSDQSHFRISQGTVWDGQTLHELYSQAAMPWEWQPKLKAVAEELGMDLFSSPFDETAVTFLESMDVGAYKIASFEIVDTGLLAAVAQTGKPVIVSTGMATEEDIQIAITTLRKNGCDRICLLKCTSAYPAPPESMNLRTIGVIQEKFDVAVGLSDHTRCNHAAIAAVALGASVIEKHITLDRNDGGPDSSFSLEPHEFAEMVTAVRVVEASIGQVHFGPTQYDAANVAFRRSLFAVADIKSGEAFSAQNVRSIRPGQGIPPKHLPDLIDRRAANEIPRGTPISWLDVA